jgi:signal transduction histidine kinase
MASAFGIARQVRKILLDQFRPCFLLLDGDFRVLALEGDAAHYGYDGLAVGSDCRELMPFLFGLGVGEAIHLPLVETIAGRAADVLFAPFGEHQSLLLTDASRERSARQVVQQQANDIRLLHKQQQKLMEELRRARDELELKHRAAEDVSRTKSRFIASLSHEFRTPLTGILGHIDLLGDPRRDPDAIADNVRSIESNATHLLSLVDNVLDQASLEVGQLTLHPVPTRLNALCREIQTTFAPLARQRGLEFRLHRRGQLPEWIEIDVTRLRQVVINLVGNGIKYTETGFVALIITWAGDQLQISVSDTGPGIPQAARERIFLPFQRELSTSGKQGAGLGLAISAQLVGLMGGELRLQDRPGGGSVFGFAVPAPAIGTSAGARADGGGHRVLLVDDSGDIRVLFSRILSRSGFVVDSAADEPEASERFERNRPDVVLVDLYLKEWEGTGLIKRLRARGFTSGVIAWSASSLREDRQRALSSGADSYLVKPVEPGVLCASLNEVLHRREPGV